MKIACKWLENILPKKESCIKLLLLGSYDPPHFSLLLLQPPLNSSASDCYCTCIATQIWEEQQVANLVDKVSKWLDNYAVPPITPAIITIDDHLVKNHLHNLPPNLPIEQLPEWIKLQLPNETYGYSYWPSYDRAVVLSHLDKTAAKWLFPMLQIMNITQLIAHQAIATFDQANEYIKLDLASKNGISEQENAHWQSGVATSDSLSLLLETAPNSQKTNSAPTAIAAPSVLDGALQDLDRWQEATKMKLNTKQFEQLKQEIWLAKLSYWWMTTCYASK